MMITPQVLSIPPYFSTPWKEISFLYTLPEEDNIDLFTLVVILHQNTRISVPNLDRQSIETVFAAHSRFFQFQEDRNFDLLNFSMGHNPAEFNKPDLPKELIEKTQSIKNFLGIENLAQIPKFEPDCNCPFCQISRALFNKQTEEELSESDLTFRSWEVKQSSEKVYLVINPQNPNESYSVYLGEPLGCTCGQKNCEHIRAVLNT